MKDPKNIPDVTIGLNLAVGMLVFVFIGYFIDQRIGEGHAGLIIGICLGFVYIAYEVWKLIRHLNE